jgi:hypothetical protein
METLIKQKTQTLYVIDPTNFTGQIINTMTSNTGMPKYLDYMERPTTLEEYKKQKGNNNIIALTWEDFRDKYYIPHLNTLQEDFKPTTKERFWDALECLPPKKWTQDKANKQEYFYLGECYTATLYKCFVRKGNKYFSALRDINTSSEDIFNLKSI